jgi:uncharacterized protein (DUF952 family)
MPLFCVAESTAWEDARAAGVYAPASLKDEGFVHLSTAAQVHATIRRHYAGRVGLVLLSIEPELLTAELRWEEGEPGEQFPHLYGPIPLDAVTDVRDLTVTTWER